MKCKGFLEWLLKLLNLLLTLLGLAIVGYGIHLSVMYENATDPMDIVPSNEGLTAVSSSSNSFFNNLSTAWFIYIFIGVGAIVFVISCFGWIGAETRNRCYLTCYSLLVIMLIFFEVGCAAFIFFDKRWRAEIPTDKTGELDKIYGFLRKNWNICKWVALGAVILEAVIFVLALMVRAANAPAEYDSDYELVSPWQQRQPLISKGFLEWLLKLLNLLLSFLGLAMVGYGIYLFVKYENATDPMDVVPSNEGPMSVSPSSNSFFDNLPTAWFIYMFIGVGAILFVISCFGWIGAETRNWCCLSCYSLLVIMLIVLEVGCAAFIFFDKSWRAVIPNDKTGEFDRIYGFLRKNWNICKWVALGAVILEAVIFVIALMIRAANAPAEYDSDYEFISPRQQRQPLISRQLVPSFVSDGRKDAWSTRMREKYGLDTSEFTYNSQSKEEKSEKRKQD